MGSSSIKLVRARRLIILNLPFQLVFPASSLDGVSDLHLKGVLPISNPFNLLYLVSDEE